jgi:hypothetical protein
MSLRRHYGGAKRDHSQESKRPLIVPTDGKGPVPIVRTHRGTTKPFSVADEAALKQRRPTPLCMAKTNISNADLVWVFTEKLKSFGDCSPAIFIAIVPSKDGWSTIASWRDRHAHPLCAKRIEQVQWSFASFTFWRRIDLNGQAMGRLAGLEMKGAAN